MRIVEIGILFPDQPAAEAVIQPPGDVTQPRKTAVKGFEYLDCLAGIRDQGLGAVAAKNIGPLKFLKPVLGAQDFIQVCVRLRAESRPAEFQGDPLRVDFRNAATEDNPGIRFFCGVDAMQGREAKVLGSPGKPAGALEN